MVDCQMNCSKIEGALGITSTSDPKQSGEITKRHLCRLGQIKALEI